MREEIKIPAWFKVICAGVVLINIGIGLHFGLMTMFITSGIAMVIMDMVWNGVEDAFEREKRRKEEVEKHYSTNRR